MLRQLNQWFIAEWSEQMFLTSCNNTMFLMYTCGPFKIWILLCSKFESLSTFPYVPIKVYTHTVSMVPATMTCGFQEVVCIRKREGSLWVMYVCSCCILMCVGLPDPFSLTTGCESAGGVGGEGRWKWGKKREGGGEQVWNWFWEPALPDTRDRPVERTGLEPPPLRWSLETWIAYILAHCPFSAPP